VSLAPPLDLELLLHVGRLQLLVRISVLFHHQQGCLLPGGSNFSVPMIHDKVDPGNVRLLFLFLGSLVAGHSVALVASRV